MRASSNIADDVWHADPEAGAYEWWYFDAISDDGRDTLVIIFLAGFLFSPAYNRAVRRHLRGGTARRAAPRPADFPAISICHYRDGRPRLRVVAEYDPQSFAASIDRPACRIGRNSFELRADEHGNNCYVLSLAQPLRRGRALEAELVWRVIEGDLLPTQNQSRVEDAGAHDWNLVAPRCDVAGTISVIEKGGGGRFVQRFAGLGYHDHNRDRRWIPRAVDSWQWGRAHFPSATAVFYRFGEKDAAVLASRLFTVSNNALDIRQADLQESDRRRNIFGLSYPRQMRFETPGARTILTVNQKKVIDSSFFYLRFLSEAMLETEDGRQERALAITEHLAPRALAWPALWWLINMRIGKADRRASFLP
ncbi:MAG: hypothetical protein WKF30_02175 [Pyrinomonadaceae bacterium]